MSSGPNFLKSIILGYAVNPQTIISGLSFNACFSIVSKSNFPSFPRVKSVDLKNFPLEDCGCPWVKCPPKAKDSPIIFPFNGSKSAK